MLSYFSCLLLDISIPLVLTCVMRDLVVDFVFECSSLVFPLRFLRVLRVHPRIHLQFMKGHPYGLPHHVKQIVVKIVQVDDDSMRYVCSVVALTIFLWTLARESAKVMRSIMQ